MKKNKICKAKRPEPKALGRLTCTEKKYPKVPNKTGLVFCMYIQK